VRLPRRAHEAAEAAAALAARQRERNQRRWIAGDRDAELERARKRMVESLGAEPPS